MLFSKTLNRLPLEPTKPRRCCQFDEIRSSCDRGGWYDRRTIYIYPKVFLNALFTEFSKSPYYAHVSCRIRWHFVAGLPGFVVDNDGNYHQKITTKYEIYDPNRKRQIPRYRSNQIYQDRLIQPVRRNSKWCVTDGHKGDYFFGFKK